jgi:hypothetical protein
LGKNLRVVEFFGLRSKLSGASVQKDVFGRDAENQKWKFHVFGRESGKPKVEVPQVLAEMPRKPKRKPGNGMKTEQL